jgi:CBS domain-containing protein
VTQPVRARDLATPYPSLAPEAPAEQAARLLAEEPVEGVFVQDQHGGLQGVVTDTALLGFLLPRYLAEDRALVGVLGEDVVEALWQRLAGRPVRELLSTAMVLVAEVDDDATLVEVAAALVRSGAALVVVRDPGGRLLGGITTSRLLTCLLGER